MQQFLVGAFSGNAPLFLILMLTEDKNLMEGLFDIEGVFCQNLLAADRLTDRDRKYMKNFYAFLNPFNSNASIKPLLKYLLPIDKNAVIPIPILPDYTLAKPPKSSASFPVDLSGLLNQVFTCLTS